MKYEVTKEQILEAHADACNEWKEKLEEWFPKVFEQKCEVGKWYWASERAKSEKRYLFYYNGEEETFGFDWSKSWSNALKAGINPNGIKATKDEVKEMLIKEAKIRGYNKQNIISLPRQNEITKAFNEDFTLWNYIENTLFTERGGYGGYVVFDNGKWAEIFDLSVEVSKSDIAKLMNVEVSNLKIVD
ncbi:hypothetical protein EH151_12825 [Elizabethkingia anophelis]|uniref:hypothetical protein n=1 Tax=Elizabethkingia anophelis TaxID=1117645 RepID=UPI0013708267|nr:hypothetical protein [Elizabethkingia anophelis]MYZ60770.1 hypothetical protein [Elizabethkingia anophelis]